MAVENIDSDAADETVDYNASTTSTALTAHDDNSNDSQGRAYFDVYNTIGSGSTIDACTLSWVNITYGIDGSKPPTDQAYIIYIWTGSTWYTVDSGTYPGAGADSILFDATMRGHIGGGIGTGATPSSGYDTDIMFLVQDPGPGRYRTWTVASYEHASAQPRLAITYTEAATGNRRMVIISC